MKNSPFKSFEVREKQSKKANMFQKKQNVQIHDGNLPFVGISFFELIKKLLLGLQKLWVALKYQFHQLTGGTLDNVQLPWFKIGLVAFGLFILMKKNLTFQFNMRAPIQTVSDDQRNGNSQNVKLDEFGLAQNVSWEEAEVKAVPAKPVAVRPVAATSSAAVTLNSNQINAYVKRFMKVARIEMDKFGIPASVKMAQGILESQANTAKATQKTNNHFGQPMATQTYKSAWANWRAHSNFMVKSDYKKLLKNGKNYKKWASDLQTMKYSDDPAYAQKLVNLIEKFELYRLDK